MKAYVFFLCMLCKLAHAFNDPLIYQPFQNSCQNALNGCFKTCVQKLQNLTQECPEKKACLARCNYHLITSMRPERCYEKCNKIPCKSTADCTLDCFKQTPEGQCRESCETATTNCTQECPSTQSKKRFPCLNCCYTQSNLCKTRCCK